MRQLRGQRGLTLIEVLIALVIVSIFAMVGLPAYTDYTVRVKVAEDVARVKDVQLRVIEHNLLNGSMPESNTQLGLPDVMAAPARRLVAFYVDAAPTPGTIKLVFDDVALPIIGDDNELWFEPWGSSGRIQWDCTGGTLANRFRPAKCRGSGGAADDDSDDDGDDDGKGKGKGKGKGDGKDKGKGKGKG